MQSAAVLVPVVPPWIANIAVFLDHVCSVLVW